MSDEARLLAALRQAHEDGRLDIDVNVRAVSRNDSPSFRTTDIVVPWFCLSAVSIYFAIAHHPATGIALFVVGAGLILALLRPYNHRRAAARTIGMGLAKVEYWQAFWRMGGLTLRGPDGLRCTSPGDDWQDFARRLRQAA